MTWNCDEIGERPDKSDGRVLATRGARQVHIITGQTPKRNISILGCCSASGIYLKPFVIYKGDREPKERSDKCSWDGAVYTATHSGWMTTTAFVTFLTKVFIPGSEEYVHYGEYRYLIVDGHASHCTLDVIKTCYENKIRLIRLPSHSTHLLQPLDVAVYKPFRTLSADGLKEIMGSIPKSVKINYFIYVIIYFFLFS